MAKQSAAVFGSPPRSESVRQLAPQLVEFWLPQASGETVTRLTTIVQAGLAPASREPLGTKREMVEFLQGRRKTSNFLHLLRAEFIHAHRESSLVPVRPTIREEARGPVELCGAGLAESYAPYEHQRTAWRELTALEDGDPPHAGLIVLPTGAGKTETAVEWLLERMEEDPAVRVLWLAHQQELLEQAIKTFQRRAASRPPGFTRRARLVFAGGSAFSTLAEKPLDVAAVTVQTAGGRWDKRKARTLEAFMRRPTYVVVDEAHHAGAKVYDRILDAVGPNARSLIGLTATPWPAGPAAGRLKRRFPVRVIEVGEGQLVEQGILARPVLHSIQTGQTVLLDETELRQATTADIPPSVLKQLQNDLRDRLVVTTWLAHRARWGKTLVFATQINHANQLHSAFEQAGAPVRVLHSQVNDAPSEILDWFRTAVDEAVLISVGMLTEGVDLPDATTAFLARPTTSRILLRQMIGRVLRGPASGGRPEAHIVDFQDRWANFAEVLEPDEVVDVDEVDPRDRDRERRLPELVGDDGETPISDDIAAQVRRAMRVVTLLASKASESAGVIDPLLVTSRLAGWYELADRRVAVFEHQVDAFDTLLSDAVGSDMRGVPFLSYFEGSHPPYPAQRALRDVVDYVREYREPPTFVAVDATIGPQIAAQQVLDAGRVTDFERAEVVRKQWEISLARATYLGFEAFEIEVERALRQLRRASQGDPKRLDPEQPIPNPARPRLKTLCRVDRPLGPIKAIAIQRVGELLPYEVASRLGDPGVNWTRRVGSSTFAHWSIKLAGKNRGAQSISVNTLLQTDPNIVSDELLAYLVYHELLHQLLPGLGHSAEFRDYEGRWPGHLALDATVDTLHERWDTRPKQYNT